MAKAVLIDTENLDLVKLGEVFGKDVAEAIAQAIGKEFPKSAVVQEGDEDESCDCDDCVDECDIEHVDDALDPDYGKLLASEENEYRLKVTFNLPGTAAEDVFVTESRIDSGDYVLSVGAESCNGDTFEIEVPVREQNGEKLDCAQTSANLEDGKLVLRFHKVTFSEAVEGRQIEVA